MRVICELNESSGVSGVNSASCHKQNSLQVATPPYKHASLTLNGTTLCNKTNSSADSSRAGMKRTQHSAFRHNRRGAFPRNKGGARMNMSSRILSQRELLFCHKYWPNVTHPPAFVAAQKNRFDAIQPLIPSLPLCNPGAVLCCVFFFSFPKRHITTENISCVPVGAAVCPLSVLAEDEQRRYSKPSKSESGTMIFTGIRRGHAGETGSLITARRAAGTVIAPGALKDGAEHLRGGKSVTTDRTTAVSEHIGGTSIPLST